MKTSEHNPSINKLLQWNYTSRRVKWLTLSVDIPFVGTNRPGCSSIHSLSREKRMEMCHQASDYLFVFVNKFLCMDNYILKTPVKTWNMEQGLLFLSGNMFVTWNPLKTNHLHFPASEILLLNIGQMWLRNILKILIVQRVTLRFVCDQSWAKCIKKYFVPN